MGEGGERASRVISQGPFFWWGWHFPVCSSQVPDGALPRLGRKAGQTSVRYGGTCAVLYCTDGLWAQSWPLTDWSCSFQLWCACSKKAGILPSTALIRL